VRPPGAVSPIGGQLRGWNFGRSKATWPERNCIIIYMYSKCSVKLGWFGMKQQNFVVCEPNFTIFGAFDVVVNAVFLLGFCVLCFCKGQDYCSVIMCLCAFCLKRPSLKWPTVYCVGRDVKPYSLTHSRKQLDVIRYARTRSTRCFIKGTLFYFCTFLK